MRENDSYRDTIIDEIPRLLSYLDREPFSKTYGSFDRFHWAWNAIEFSNADLQKFSLPLTFAYQLDEPDNPFFRDERLLTWIEAAVLFGCSSQSKQGGFDQWLPNDNSIVSAGFVIHDLILVAQLLEGSLNESTVKSLRGTALKAANFLQRYDEKHGFNSNHMLACASALLDISFWLNNDQSEEFDKSAFDIITKVISRQFESGAFLEYFGGDPGYQTLGIAFLASCYHHKPDSPIILDSLRRAIDFSTYFLSPISGNGGFYGSRGTRLLYPSGFEIAAKHNIRPEVAAVVRTIIERQLCITPRNTDIINLIPLLSDYTRAYLQSSPKVSYNPKQLPLPDLFCTETTLFSLQQGADRIRGRLNGGMITIESAHRGCVTYSSAGYILESTGTKKHNGFSGVLDGEWNRESNRMRFMSRFQKPNNIRMTPWKMLILKFSFNLFGNSMYINLLMKRILGRVLLFNRPYLQVTLNREIVLHDDLVSIADTITNDSNQDYQLSHRSEGYVGFMGSARYYDLANIGVFDEMILKLSRDGAPEEECKLSSAIFLPAQSELNITLAIPLSTAPEQNSNAGYFPLPGPRI